MLHRGRDGDLGTFLMPNLVSPTQSPQEASTVWVTLLADFLAVHKL